MGNADLQHSIEAFLYREADLLDDWKLQEWETLLTDDAYYRIPPIGIVYDSSVTPATTLFVTSDDRTAIAARVERMLGSHVWAEMPRSRLRRMITNVRILQDDGASVQVASNVTIHRVRRREITSYIGKYIHTLVRSGDSFRIREKIIALDIDVLRGQGGISVIL